MAEVVEVSSLVVSVGTFQARQPAIHRAVLHTIGTVQLLILSWNQ